MTGNESTLAKASALDVEKAQQDLSFAGYTFEIQHKSSSLCD
jgi:hypothetical protein